MTEIRSCHPYAYHSGEWGRIVATDTVTQDVASPRDCYLIAWPNGDTDLWPVTDAAADYEFREAAP